ncbi:MAG: hypothetical protein A2Y23_07450 [Clostridiales bacterium GWB2_37_7]|nr:MAG: hypothetical protein A2Y23_07450 [Clostridiales bacterium GWB2_37_7]
MKKMPMCPMMMQMPMMQMPMMQSMDMYNMNYEKDEYEADERDEEYFTGMQSENYNRMMPYVMITVDKMEKKGDMIYAEYPDKHMIERMSEEAYGNMVSEMPDMADEYEEERQYGGRRHFGRDLITFLLFNELLRRRRRRRRRRDFFYGDDDFYYYE